MRSRTRKNVCHNSSVLEYCRHQQTRIALIYVHVCTVVSQKIKSSHCCTQLSYFVWSQQLRLTLGYTGFRNKIFYLKNSVFCQLSRDFLSLSLLIQQTQISIKTFILNWIHIKDSTKKGSQIKVKMLNN